MLPAAGAPWVGAGCGGQVWEPQGCVNAPAPPVHPNPACWAAAGGSILDQEPALEGCVQPCYLVSLFKACVTDGTQRRGLLCDFMLCLSVVLLFMYVFLLTSCFFGLWFPPMCCSISLLNGLAVTLQPSSTLPWAAQSLRGWGEHMAAPLSPARWGQQGAVLRAADVTAAGGTSSFLKSHFLLGFSPQDMILLNPLQSLGGLNGATHPAEGFGGSWLLHMAAAHKGDGAAFKGAW